MINLFTDFSVALAYCVSYKTATTQEFMPEPTITAIRIVDPTCGSQAHIIYRPRLKKAIVTHDSNLAEWISIIWPLRRNYH